MLPLRNALFASMLVFPLLSVGAQTGAPPAAVQPSFEIRGRIVDTANAPLPGASVSLRLKGSDATLAGAIAGKDGNFRVTGLRPGTFTIRVVSIGYSPVIQEITIAPNTPVLDLGVAKLAPTVTALSDISVNKEKDAIITQPDRNVYSAKDLAPGAANASELLENVPSVQVDIDGKVSLRGNENVVVQINGRPTPMRGTQLAAYLKSISANVIDRIEVLPNPSAKYDPEGMAGIINIALKSNVDLGLSGSLNTSIANANRYNNSLNVGYQTGPWTTFASGGMVSERRTAIGVHDRERYDASAALLNTTAQDIRLQPSNKGQNFNFTVDYKLSPRDVLSNALLLNHRGGAEASTINQALVDPAGGATDEFMRRRAVDVKGFMYDYDVALKRTYAPRTNELSVEFRFNRAHDEDASDERRLTTGGYINGRIDRNDALNRQFTGQLDYVRAFGENTKLETGWKSTERWIDRNFAVSTDTTGVGIWKPSALSNGFTFEEGVHALYAVVSQSVKQWDLQAGLRGEYADRVFSLETQRYPYGRTSFFPSAVALYNVNDATQLKASYSRRIRRPGTPELNPFPTYFDADNVFLGNPQLNPEYTDAFEFGLTNSGPKGLLQISPFYRKTSDIIRIDVNSAGMLYNREVTLISFKNLAKSDSWGSDLTGQLRLAPFNIITNLSVYKLVTDGGSETAASSDAVGWNGRLNVMVDVTKSLFMQLVYNYRAGMKIERGEMGASQSAAFAIRKKIQGEKGAILLRIADPFEMINFHIRTGDAKVVQLTERNPQTRAFFLGYQYSFGRPPRVRQVAPDQTSGGSVGFGAVPGAAAGTGAGSASSGTGGGGGGG